MANESCPTRSEQKRHTIAPADRRNLANAYLRDCVARAASSRQNAIVILRSTGIQAPLHRVPSAIAGCHPDVTQLFRQQSFLLGTAQELPRRAVITAPKYKAGVVFVAFLSVGIRPTSVEGGSPVRSGKITRLRTFRDTLEFSVRKRPSFDTNKTGETVLDVF